MKLERNKEKKGCRNLAAAFEIQVYNHSSSLFNMDKYSSSSPFFIAFLAFNRSLIQVTVIADDRKPIIQMNWRISSNFDKYKHVIAVNADLMICI